MEKRVYAKFNNCLISAQKVRLVADLIRGTHVSKAEAILQITNKSAAKDILKTLNSAIANAVHNEGWDKKELMVAEIYVDEAQTYKRGRPAARGRYRSILKRNSHITIGLEQVKVKEEKVEKKEEVKAEVKSESKTKSKGTKVSKKVISKK
jgi:large subunit ribosomal protein L22